jgi:soluble lytic murein transglycosylase
LPITTTCPARLTRAILATLAILGSNTTDANEEEFATARAAFMEARAIATAGVDLSDATDSAELRSYVLYPYLQAARIRHRLLRASTPDSEADALAADFLLEHAGEPVGFELHREWLFSLAERGHWSVFLDVYDRDVTTPRMDCQYLAARIELQETRGLEEMIVDRWLAPEQLPIECERAFQWLRDRGRLDAELTEERLYLLLENDQASFARIVARQLPPERASRWLQWAALILSPSDAIDALLRDTGTEIWLEALFDGFARLATGNPTAAHARYPRLVNTFALNRDQADRLAVALALGFAWDRQADLAIETFSTVRDQDLDDYDLGWLARASLWAGDWNRARATIESMSDGARATSVWRYWLGRSIERTGEGENAVSHYRATFGDDNFYSALAAARLGERVIPRLDRVERNLAVLTALGSRPEFLRARELYFAGMLTAATREWRVATVGLTDRERKQSILLASDWGWHDAAVAMATDEGVFYDYPVLYPLPFRGEIENAARTTGVRPTLLAGLVRQESLFQPEAVSTAGAIGLAQLSPDTARRTALRWQQTPPTRDELFEPATNVLLGAAELSGLMTELSQPVPVVLAAYNAGPAAARRWLPDAPMEADVWIENIPYNETRQYVRRVLWHDLVYEWLDTGQPGDAGRWLTPVEPAGAIGD